MNKTLRIRFLLVFFLVFLSISTVFAQDPDPQMTFEEAMDCVQRVIPAESYVTNEYLPDVEPGLEDIGPTPGGYTTTHKVVVKLGWIKNAEFTQLYLADVLAYFAEEGLEVELIPSDYSGTSPLLPLGGGAVDIAIVAGGSEVPIARVSVTPIESTVVGSLLKSMAFVYLTTIPELQGRPLTPEDLVGRTIATQQGAEFYTRMLFDKFGLEFKESQFTGNPAGFDALEIRMDPRLADFYTGWFQNQPYIIELDGLPWNGYLFVDADIFNEPSDVIAVLDDTLETEEGQDIVRRFLRATYRGTQFLLRDPEAAANITAEYADEGLATYEIALWRFQHQEELIYGDDQYGLLATSYEQWDDTIASRIQYEADVDSSICD